MESSISNIIWRKKGIILEPIETWEDSYIQNFSCCCEPLGDKNWRLWYSANCGLEGSFNIAIAEGKIGGNWKRYQAQLNYKESANVPLSIMNLPKNWHPVQPIHIKLSNKYHRLYFWAHGPGVVRFLAAESKDGKRYEVLNSHDPCLYHPNDRAAINSSTAKVLGLTPSLERIHQPSPNERPAPDEIITNDATNVYLLPDGTFEMYTVGLVKVSSDDPRYIPHDNAAGWIRVIDRLTSEDGLQWKNRQRVIQPDANDPPDLQFYYLSVTYTQEGRIGLLGHYRAEAQTMDIELCFSKDGINWERPFRKPWIQRGKPGEPDCYGIYSPNSLIYDDGKWWLFYTGVNYSHNFRHSYGPARSVIMLATSKTL